MMTHVRRIAVLLVAGFLAILGMPATLILLAIAIFLLMRPFMTGPPTPVPTSSLEAEATTTDATDSEPITWTA